MPIQIRLTVKELSLKAELFDTPCARAIADILPLEATINEWGDEFYFSIDLEMPLDETANTAVKIGDIGYWPPGKSMAIFFGPTPMSTGSDPVPASDVNIVGRIIDDATLLREARSAEEIRISIERNYRVSRNVKKEIEENG
jgi:hypothetical protein